MINIELVWPDGHFLHSDLDYYRTHGIFNFNKGWNFKYHDERSAVVLAVDDANSKNKVVGIFKFDITDNLRYLDAFGTWVHAKYRRKGIAKQLWMKALDEIKPRLINVAVSSDRGYTLIKSLTEQYLDIDFRVEDMGDRTLRDLRQIKRKAA